MTSAPAPIGPYRSAVEAGGLVFTAGQIALDPATGRLVEGDAAAQAARALENLRAVLEAAGTSLDRAVRVTLYLRSMADYEAVNRVWAAFFPKDPPARSCVAVTDLPRGALVLVDAVARS